MNGAQLKLMRILATQMTGNKKPDASCEGCVWIKSCKRIEHINKTGCLIKNQ